MRRSECRACHAPIAWAITEANGRRIPVDANPDGSWRQVEDGPLVKVGTTWFDGREVVVVATRPTSLFDSPDEPRFDPHQRTCPMVEEFRA